MGTTRLKQELNYFYWDPDCNLASLTRTGAVSGEIEFMMSNLEIFLNEDKLYVNEEEKSLHVISCSIEFFDEDDKQPVTVFEIESDPYLLKKGINKIKLVALKEKVSYPCKAEWSFPGMVLKVASLMNFVIKENTVELMVKAEEHVGGEEEFVFLNTWNNQY
ncbi:MAG: hypothetical protein ACTSP4_03830 [Candidatus Hodarchaeales archaeon]